MPYYKGVYYADGAAAINAALISSEEAYSIDATIESIRNSGMVVPVANAAARDIMFPTPVDGNAVWLQDSAIEQRYITGAGWVAYSDGMMPIPVPSAVPSGTGSSFKTLGVGGLTFDKCTGLTINNIFTKEFDNYKVIINLDSTSAADTFGVRYTTNGANNSTTNYIRAGFGAADATPTVYQNTSAGSAVMTFGSSITRNSTLEIDFMRPAYGYYPLAISKCGWNNNSTGQAVGMLGCQYNSGTTTFDGIYIYSIAGTATMTGTVKIYGYN